MSVGKPRPILAFDLDGVLARPLLGRNPTIQRDLRERASSQRHRAISRPQPTLYDRLLIATYYRIRHRGRRLALGAHSALHAARRQHSVVLLSARDWRARQSTETWLHDHELHLYFDAIILNDSGLPAAEFKRNAAARYGLTRLVDDDARTAALLARDGLTVDLIDWPRNRGLDFPPGITRWKNLHALAANLATTQSHTHG